MKITRNKTLVMVIVLILIIGFMIVFSINSLYKRYRPYVSSTYLLNDFSHEYIDENRGKIIVDIPEIFEMIYIMIAVSDEGESPYVRKDTRYFETVKERFSGYKDHEAVKLVSDILKNRSIASLGTIFSYHYEDGDIKNGEHKSGYHLGAFEHILNELTDFYHDSGFKDFYNEMQSYYYLLKSNYLEQVDVDDMKNWLEDNFPYKYNTVRIISSPLMGGSHYTHNYKDKQSNYSEIAAFVPLFTTEDPDSDLDNIIVSRFLFTELNHNYINPTTDRILNLRKVVNLYSDRNKWYNGRGYDSPSLIFNEYMTWAVFNLYVYDRYEENIFDKINTITIDVMENYRLFEKFERFNDILLDLYVNRKPDQTVSGLYIKLLNQLKK